MCGPHVILRAADILVPRYYTCLIQAADDIMRVDGYSACCDMDLELFVSSLAIYEVVYL